MTSESGHEGNGEQPVRPGDQSEPELDIDTAFAAIVAGWASDPGPEVGAWPAAEDLDTGPETRSPPHPEAGTTGGRPGGAADTPTEGRIDKPTDRPVDDPADKPTDRPVDKPADTSPGSGQADGGGGGGEILLPPSVRSGTSLTSGTVGPRDVGPGAATDREEGFVPPEPPPLPRGDLVTRLLWIGVIGGPLFLVLAAIVWRGAPQLLILGAVAAFVGGFVTLVVRMPRDRGEDDDDGAVV